ncbi:hypothetical protein AWB75_02483 [Caballeronia catudaia]|uniref:Uncharacterized protein n=1 Tax=Caballeronia catudaia TaxID=1777136 RepID=A0A158AQ81_9BURK|nr:hypothetical protein [Caballeronia catudaia]SAK59905.1 hypothetical protein AWB75_02483 [Caballeronia catudaia]
MDDFFTFEAAARERTNPRMSTTRPTRARRAHGPGGDRPELGAGEPIDIYHWAAVALVTALMCAVLGYAAGTPALARAANVTSLVFGAMGGALTASGVVRSLRARLAAGGRLAVARVPVAESQ